MKKIAYFSNGSSIYDYFFISKLSQKFNILFLTFNPTEKVIQQNTKVVVISELIRRSLIHDSIRIYSSIPIRYFLLKSYLRKYNPDILIGCGGLDYGFISALSQFKPFVLFIWGSEVLVWPKFLPFRAMIKYSLKKADLVVVDSDVQRNACIKLGYDGKIVKLPWVDSIELKRLSERVKVEKDELRNRIGWSSGDPVVICTRLHEKIYDIETIIRAIPVVLRREPRTRFIFVGGGGSLTEKLKAMTKKLNVEKNVYFTGYVPRTKIFYYLKNSDIYVSSSLSDGTSASLLEAMICKLPCVVSDIPGNREWIKENENGLLFPTKDYNALAQKIIMLIKNDHLSKELGEKAAKTVEEKANWDKTSQALYEALENLQKRKL
ncbi:MAG: glycosyltransferase family 4 protein [Candidatus Methanomethylicia archaeon]